MSDKLSSRLGTTEIQTIQSRMFPFDAWESENASRYTQPKIKVLEPYKFYASYRPTVHSVDEDDLTITDTDGYDLVLVTTGADARTITLPTVADNTDRIIRVMKADSGAGKVVLDGEGAETIVQIGGTSFATMEMFYQGDFIEVVSDGSNWLKLNACEWHRMDDPTVGYKAQKASWSPHDDFSAGLEMTFSSICVGSIAALCALQISASSGYVMVRPSGDANISNNPWADQEYHCIIAGDLVDFEQVILWLNGDAKCQVTVSNANVDVNFTYPSAYLL